MLKNARAAREAALEVIDDLFATREQRALSLARLSVEALYTWDGDRGHDQAKVLAQLSTTYAILATKA